METQVNLFRVLPRRVLQQHDLLRKNLRLILVVVHFADHKNRIAGLEEFFEPVEVFVEAKDLDEATSLAARIPSAKKGTVEVRPLAE